MVRHIRDKGAMRACLSTVDLNSESVVEKARLSPPMENRELASAWKLGMSVNAPKSIPAIMIGLRPTRSDNAPKNTTSGVPKLSATMESASAGSRTWSRAAYARAGRR